MTGPHGPEPRQDDPYAGPPPTVQPQAPYGQMPYGQVPYGQVPSYGHPPLAYGGYPPAPYGQPPYGYDPRWRAGPVRPGQATAAAVLAWVCSGLLIVGALIVFAGASVLSDISDATNGRADAYTSEFIADGVLNLVAAGLLISGGAVLFARSGTGRLLLSGGSTLVAALSVYWLARWTSLVGSGAFVFWALVYGALVVLCSALCWSRPVMTWLTSAGAASSDQPAAG